MPRSDQDYPDDVLFDPDGYAAEIEISTAVRPDKSVKEIDDENQFIQMPDGEHLLNVSRITVVDKLKHYECWLGKRKAGYNSTSIRVVFSLPDQPRCQVSDLFILPPADDEELVAYNIGGKEDGKSAGFMAAKLKNFVGHLGFQMPADNTLPEEAAKLKNWLFWPDGKTPRQVVATSQVPKNPGVDEKGNPRTAYAQIKLFSYKDAPVPPQFASNAGKAQTKKPSGNGGKAAPVPAGKAETAKAAVEAGEFDV